MEEDSTTDKAAVSTGADDEDIDSSSTTGKTDDNAAESGDATGDNAPSDSDDKSGDDESKDKAAGKTPAFDKDLGEWAKKAGFGELDNDKERKLAQVARDNQRDFSRRQQATASAKKVTDAVAATNKPEDGDDDDDPMAKRLSSVENELLSERNNRRTSEYFTAQSEAGKSVPDAEAEAMSKLLERTAKEDGKVGVDFLLKDVGRWHRLAKAEVADDGDDDVATQAAEKARVEERKRLEKKQQASSTSRSASTSQPAKQKDEVAKIWEDDSI